jgi:hypothetical protein
VNTPPKFPGGLTAFQAFIDDLSAELSEFMPITGPERMYVDVEFVIDTQGHVVNVKPGSRANNEMNNHILDRFEAMPAWRPATRQDKAVPMRLVQNLVIEARPAKPTPKKEESDD